MYSANDGFARLTIFHQMTIGVSKTKTTILHREWLEDAEFVVGGVFEVGDPFFVSTYLANPFKTNMKCIFSKIFKTLLGGEIRLRDGRHACTRLATRLGFEKTKPENEEKRAQRIMHSAQVQHWKWESRRKISYTPFGKNIQMTYTTEVLSTFFYGRAPRIVLMWRGVN